MSRWCFLLGIHINSIVPLRTPGDVWGMFTLLVAGVGIWSGTFGVLSRQKMVEWLQTVTTHNNYNRQSSNGLEWQVLWSFWPCDTEQHELEHHPESHQCDHVNWLGPFSCPKLPQSRPVPVHMNCHQRTSRDVRMCFFESPVYPIKQNFKKQLVAHSMP